MFRFQPMSGLGWRLGVLLLGSGAVAQATPTLAERTAAVNAVVTGDARCTALTPFYWEIGDASAMRAKGTGGTGSKRAPTALTPLAIASASKWVFAAQVLQENAGVLTAEEIARLNLTAGYSNLSACTATTVAGCLAEAGVSGGTNGDFISATEGGFAYGGGHMQVLATERGMGPFTTANLTTDIRASLPGLPQGFSFGNTQLAAGLSATPNAFGLFLRKVLAGTYRMKDALGANAVCTQTNSANCPTAIFSPINQTVPGPVNDISDEAWHYSLGHWVEDDPVVGDGAYSSPGRYGFYPWIDAGKAWYGVLARQDTANAGSSDPQRMPWHMSIACGRAMRAAWLNPTAP